MSRHERDYVIRLSAKGKAELERDLKALGLSGEKSLKRIKTATKPASAGLRETDRAARGLSSGLRSVSRELPELQRVARFMGGAALIGAMAAFARSALDVGKTFQAAMKRVEAATHASAGEMDRLSAKATEMGATTAFTATEAAGAIEVLAKNGMSVADILGGGLDATLSLASALGADLAPSADLATDVMLQFNLQASQLPEIADAVTGAALKSKFGFDDLRLAIGQAGGVAGKFGVDVQDFLTALAATSSAFSSGEDAGTSFKTFLQRLVPQSKQAAAAMAQLGFEFFDEEGRMKSLADISEELRTGIDGLSDAARNDALQKIFGTDAIRTALMLAETGGDGFRDLAEGIGKVSAQEQAEVRLRGLQGALRELASAWEALQLESANNGGLDVSEAAVRRFTEALRYLRDNFQQVEEVVERVAQALVVVLVRRGVTLAIAKAIALRAAYVELAAQVTGVGTAASRALGPLSRMGLAARALTGILGGPLGLAFTAASIAALAIDFDKAADAIDNADEAGMAAKRAMDAYAEASKRAAQEQENLGRKVSETTEKMLKKSRAALQEALRKEQGAQAELRDTLLGVGLLNGDKIVAMNKELFRAATTVWVEQGRKGQKPKPKFDPATQPWENLGPVFSDLANMLLTFRQGKIGASELWAELERVAGAGEEVTEKVRALDAAMEAGDQDRLGAARAGLVEMATLLGGFDEELAAVAQARDELDRIDAFEALRRALLNTVAASEALHASGAEGLYGLVEAAAASEGKIADLKAMLDGTWEDATDKPEKTFVEQLGEDAEESRRKLEDLDRAYARYRQRTELTPESTDRGAWQRGELKAAKSGILDLIAYVEGTDKGRSYNETLGYGAFTGGPVNLISMTLNEIRELQRQMLRHPDNTYNSSAVGRYQIVGTTLQGLIDDLGLSGDALFDKNMQDRLAMELVRRRMGQGRSGFYSEWQGFEMAGTPWATIQSGLGAQSIPRMDPELAKSNSAAAEQRRRVLEEQEEAMRRLIEAGDEQAAQLELETALYGKTRAEQARLIYMHKALTEARAAGIDVETEQTATGEKLIDVIRRQADAIALRTAEEEKARDGYFDEAERLREAKDAVRNAFDSLRGGGEGWKGFFDSIVDYAADKLWELAMDPVWDFLAKLLDQGLNMLFGAIGGWGGVSVVPSAMGNVFSAGQVMPFAAGGVVSGPTVFPMRHGIGLMGEAGPEAIMPLSRGADGKLGVRASGAAAAAAAPAVINITVAGASGDDHIVKLVQQGVETGLRTYDRQLPARFGEVRRDPRRRQ